MNDLSSLHPPGSRLLHKKEHDLPIEMPISSAPSGPKKPSAKELKAFTVRLDTVAYQAMQRLSERQSASLQDTLTKAVHLYLKVSDDTRNPAQLMGAPKLMSNNSGGDLGSVMGPHIQAILQSFHDLSIERRTLGLEVNEALSHSRLAGAHAENVNQVLSTLADRIAEINERQTVMTEFIVKLDNRIAALSQIFFTPD